MCSVWSKGNTLKALVINQKIRFGMIRIEFAFSHFKSIPLWGLWGPVVRFSGTSRKGKKPLHFARFSEL